MFAEPPPAPPTPPPPPAAEVIRNETASTPAANRDAPFIYVRGAQSEKVLMRHQVFLRTEVETHKRRDGAFECVWAIVPFLQRVPCVEAITGQLACAEDYTTRLGERETGRADLPPADQGQCTLAYAPIQAAQARLLAAAKLNAPKLFDEDMARNVRPELKAAGIAIRLPGQPTPARPRARK